jgi:hypothetical protein
MRVTEASAARLLTVPWWLGLVTPPNNLRAPRTMTRRFWSLTDRKPSGKITRADTCENVPCGRLRAATLSFEIVCDHKRLTVARQLNFNSIKTAR